MAIPRIDWVQLPHRVRHAVEAHTGPVQSATTVGDGQNSALATILLTQQGQVFLKGLRTNGRGVVTQQREAAINPYVRAVSPELLWRTEAHGWDLLCFEYVEGRSADYAPGSADLPALINAMRRLAALPCPDLPATHLKLAERRWSAFIDGADARDLLRGDTLLHTDYNPTNILVTHQGDARIIDWAWPTKGAAWVDPACLVPRLIASGHTAAGAETWASECPAWAEADPATIDVFATALCRMWGQIAQDRPDEAWKQNLAESARQWHEHRSAAIVI